MDPTNFRHFDNKTNEVKYAVPSELPKRPGMNKQGREVSIGLNTFNVLKFPTKPVYQYDVLIGSGAEKRGLIKKIWNSTTVQKDLGQGWIFDGNRLAWSLINRSKEVRLSVDLDQEQGRPPRKGANADRNTHRIYLKASNVVKFDSLQGYLDGKGPFDNACLEAITFLDHLMRQTPSARYTQIKKSFFSRGQDRFLLGGGIEAFKGVFASMRAVHTLENNIPKARLSVNVDVANGTFWTDSILHDAAALMCKQRSAEDFARAFGQCKRDWKRSAMFITLKRLRKVSVYVTHRKLEKRQEFVIEDILPQDPHEYRFEQQERDQDGNVTESRRTSLADYFRDKYQISLKLSLPVVKMTKKIRGSNVVQPMDVCRIIENQRYQYKLDEKQTSAMIKFAVTLPEQRWAAITHGLNMLNWENDKFLANYGLSIDRNITTVKGRILPAPDVNFGNGGIPGKVKFSSHSRSSANSLSDSQWWQMEDRWQEILPSQHYAYQGMGRLRRSGSWSGRSDHYEQLPQELRANLQVAWRCFCERESRKFYVPSWVKIASDLSKVVQPGNLARGGEMISDIWTATGNKHQMKPQLLFFIVPDKSSDLYSRIKKSCDCRYGVVSQVLQAAHVQKCQDQYISNVCMKVNAKMGGTTSRAVGAVLSRIAKASMAIPTMCIGADVSHAAPGSEAGSMAALTMSTNLDCTRYAAQCNTNGHRVEIITTANIKDCLRPLLENYWIPNIGGGRLPQRILYFRDGVSEGQYQHVLDQEVRDMKLLMCEINPKADVKFTVIVASKRHHVRFFPVQGAGDRNGNPQPGTLVETGVTHPFEFDFFLCAHSAIKGTARPIHYHILLNEANMTAEELQQLTFEHSFQYARSTTPVSQFPAVYYAHLASNRARAHENKPTIANGKKETAVGKKTTVSSDKPPTEIPPLIDMNDQLLIKRSMWYI